MATASSQGANEVLVGKAFPYRHTIDWHHWVVFGVQDKSGDLDPFDVLQAAPCIIVCGCALKLWMCLDSPFLIKISPCLNFHELFHIEVKYFDHFLENDFFFICLYFRVSLQQVVSEGLCECCFVPRAPHQVDSQPDVEWIIYRYYRL